MNRKSVLIIASILAMLLVSAAISANAAPMSQALSISCFKAGPSGGADGSDNSGGTSNTEYNDVSCGNMTKIGSVSVKFGNWIDSIEIRYVDIRTCGNVGDSWWLGGGGGDHLGTLQLACDEYVTSIGGMYDRYVDRIWVNTNKCRRLLVGGYGGAKHFFYDTPKGLVIRDLWGHTDDYVDALGVVYESPGKDVARPNCTTYTVVPLAY